MPAMRRACSSGVSGSSNPFLDASVAAVQALLRDQPCHRGRNQTIDVFAPLDTVANVARRDVDRLDLTVDGADEIDPALNLIKGGGGALLREKIVAAASDRMIVIADDSKWVEVLGRFPLPVEVIPFGLAATQRAIGKAFAQSGVSGQMMVRKGRDGHVFVTDGGHWIVDAHLGRISDAPRLAGLLAAIPGVVEHGLFIGLATVVMLAGPQGIRVIERPHGRNLGESE